MRLLLPTTVSNELLHLLIALCQLLIAFTNRHTNYTYYSFKKLPTFLIFRVKII
jgi:hypothetical protein